MLKTLQAGRGLAALAVAAFHLSVIMGLPRYGGEAVFAAVTGGGFLGVDFFFVLSGFIILMAHRGDIGRPERWRAYALKRFVRVYPIYWLYTGAVLAAVALGLGVVQVPTGWRDWISTFSLVRASDGPTPISVAWSLFHEVAFYAAFGVLILSRRWGLALMALWVAAILAVWTWPDPERDRSVIATLFGTCNLHFLTGAGAFLLHGRLSRRQGLALAGAGLVGIGLLILAGDGAIHGPARLAWGLAFAAALAGAAAAERHGLRLPLGPLAFLGDASYTLYLLHTLVMGAVLKALSKLGAGALGPQAVYLLAFAGTTALCCAAFVLIERPLLGRLRRLAAPPRPTAPAACPPPAGTVAEA